MTLTIAGVVLAASTWFLSFVPIPRLSANGCGFWSVVWSDRLRILAFVLPAGSGFALSLWAERRFSRGFRDFRWTEAELASARPLLLSQSFWAWSTLSILILAIIMAITETHFKGGVLIYMLSLPGQAANRLRQMLTPSASQSSGLMQWSSLQPIRSEHWGEPHA